MTWAQTFRSIEQRSRSHAQRLRQLLKHLHRRISCSAFNIADIGAVKASLIGESLLTPALFLAQPAQVST